MLGMAQPRHSRGTGRPAVFLQTIGPKSCCALERLLKKATSKPINCPCDWLLTEEVRYGAAGGDLRRELQFFCVVYILNFINRHKDTKLHPSTEGK